MLVIRRVHRSPAPVPVPAPYRWKRVFAISHIPVSCCIHVTKPDSIRSCTPCLWLCGIHPAAFVWKRQGNSDLIAVSLWNHAHLPPSVIWLGWIVLPTFLFTLTANGFKSWWPKKEPNIRAYAFNLSLSVWHVSPFLTASSFHTQPVFPHYTTSNIINKRDFNET